MNKIKPNLNEYVLMSLNERGSFFTERGISWYIDDKFNLHYIKDNSDTIYPVQHIETVFDEYNFIVYDENLGYCTYLGDVYISIEELFHIIEDIIDLLDVGDIVEFSNAIPQHGYNIYNYMTYIEELYKSHDTILYDEYINLIDIFISYSILIPDKHFKKYVLKGYYS